MEKTNNVTLEEKEDYGDYYILGVGEGAGGYFEIDRPVVNKYPVVREKVKKGAKYISLDKLDHYRFGKSSYHGPALDEIADKWRARDENPDRTFFEGDINSMPFPDRSINEVWVENVFGDRNSTVGGETFTELGRVLVSGGKVFIVETYTPDDAIYILNTLKTIKSFKDMFMVQLYEGQEYDKFMVETLQVENRRLEKENNPFVLVLTKL